MGRCPCQGDKLCLLSGLWFQGLSLSLNHGGLHLLKTARAVPNTLVFLIFHGFVLVPPTNQSHSWIIQGFVPLSSLIFFPDFPRLHSYPFCHNLDPTAHSSKFCLFMWLLLITCLPPPTQTWLLLHMHLAKEFPPLLFYASPQEIPAIAGCSPGRLESWFLAVQEGRNTNPLCRVMWLSP